MRKTLYLVVVLVVLLLSTVNSFSQPGYSFAQKSFTKAITSMTTFQDNMIALCFSDGTCSLMDKDGRVLASQLIGPYREIFYIGYSASLGALVGVDRTGNVYVLNSSTLNIINAFMAKKSDEESFLAVSLSGDGRYLAASSRYYVSSGGKRYLETRLAIIDIGAQKRIFERDLYMTNDILVDVFSLDFWGNYLVTETIDTKRELCQLADNRIEVYKIEGQLVRKIASFQSGLTLKLIVGDFLVAQRVQQNSTGGYLTYVFTLPDLRIKTTRILDRIQSLIPCNNNSFLAIFADGTLQLCNLDLACSNLAPVPVSRVALRPC